MTHVIFITSLERYLLIQEYLILFVPELNLSLDPHAVSALSLI